jgi:hypothetical protein
MKDLKYLEIEARKDANMLGTIAVLILFIAIVCWLISLIGPALDAENTASRKRVNTPVERAR